MARKSKRIMKSRRAGRKPVYRRRATRHTAVGRIFPPVDVRNKGSLGEVLKRIKAGPITIMLVYADWCGHCKDFKPHFDAAARTPGRTVQSVKVSEPMLGPVNDAIRSMNASAAPLAVDAYPTVMLLDNKGNSITEINAVKDTQTMTKVMKEAGQNVDEVALSNPKPPKNSSAPRTVRTFNSAAANAGMSGKSVSIPTDPTMDAMESLPPVVSTRSESAEEVAGNIVLPPNNEGDIINPSEGSAQKGGSLYSAMASSAYKLAPAAVLLGLAAATTMRRRGRGRKHKTLRRRR
jgi:thiol-disulfide isomerase/thioredoxin